jgi:hypothetical protein
MKAFWGLTMRISGLMMFILGLKKCISGLVMRRALLFANFGVCSNKLSPPAC